MRISHGKLMVISVALPLLLAGCPKSKTDTSSARTEVPTISTSPSSSNAVSPVEDKLSPAKPVAKDPVPSEKTNVDTAVGVDKKPDQTKNGDELAVSATHVEVVQPDHPTANVVIEETPEPATPAPAAVAAVAEDLVEFPAVKLPGSNETVAVGAAAAAILADPQPLQAAAEVVTPVAFEAPAAAPAEAPVEPVTAVQVVAVPEVVAAPAVVVAPEVVTADVAAQLDTDLGQPIPVADVKEVELTPNTEYTLTFVDSVAAAAAPLDIATVVTLAAEPAIKAAVQQDDGSIKLSIDTNGNPKDTLYSIAIVLPATGEIVGYVDAATGAVLKEGEERFHELNDANPVVKTLKEDVELVSFVIQAQNQKSEETSWSEEVAVVAVEEDVLAVDDSTEVAADDTTLVDPASVGITATATQKDVQVRIDQGQTSLTSLKDQLKGLKAKLDSIRKELKAKNADRREIQKKLRKLEKDAKKNAKEIAQLKAELEAVQGKIDALGKQLRDVKAEIKALKGKVKDQASEIKKLKKLLAQMKKDAKAAKKNKK